MSVNHGGADVGVSEQLLNRADIVAIFQQMGGKGMGTSVKAAAGGGGELMVELRLPEAFGEEAWDLVRVKRGYR